MEKMIDFIKQVFGGKTIARILFNWQVREHCRNLTGVCVDFAGGKNPSYERYWGLKCDKFIKTDIETDLNKRLPFADNFADNAFLFNAIYILEGPEETLKEIFRILKPNGKFFISLPFIANEMPEPHDYCRFTSEGLMKILKEAGFKNIEIIPYGERFTACAYLLHNFFIFKFVRFFVFVSVLALDKLIPKKIKKLHPCPIGYFAICAR
jgi:SAM-dependent methyltransferase